VVVEITPMYIPLGLLKGYLSPLEELKLDKSTDSTDDPFKS
jgi:hypothetical protein